MPNAGIVIPDSTAPFESQHIGSLTVQHLAKSDPWLESEQNKTRLHIPAARHAMCLAPGELKSPPPVSEGNGVAWSGWSEAVPACSSDEMSDHNLGRELQCCAQMEQLGIGAMSMRWSLGAARLLTGGLVRCFR